MGSCRQAIVWFHQVLAELDPQRLLRDRTREDGRERYGRIFVFALGKAAGPMLNGWLRGGEGGAGGVRPQVWLSAPEGAPGVAAELSAPDRVVLHAYVGGHPQPNAASLAAGQAMLESARELASSPEPALLVGLISGGGSALVESPWAGGLDELSRRNRALVGSGAPIGEMNRIRQHLSAFKGGGLAAAAAGAAVDQVSWILSDVPGEDLAPVASGPTCPDSTTVTDCRRAWQRWLPELPAPEFRETRKPGDAVFSRSQWHRLANNQDACRALAERARQGGCQPVLVDATADEWEWVAAAEYLVARWRALRAQHVRPCLIAGGEVRVRLPPQPGRGGRNQLLALQIARALEGEQFCFLSAGTDGVDGSSDAAGACVDGQTLARARAAGLDLAEHLRRFDPHPVLEAAGDLLRTGPTGNNLRDLRVFI